MSRAFLVSWDEDELSQQKEMFSDAGWQALGAVGKSETVFASIQSEKPDVVVVFLNTNPDAGKAVAKLLQKTAETTYIPLVFADGDRQTVGEFDRLFSRALFTTSDGIIADIENFRTTHTV